MDRAWRCPMHRCSYGPFPTTRSCVPSRSWPITAAPTISSAACSSTSLISRDAKFVELAYKPERRYVAKVEGPQGAHSVVKFYGCRAFARVRRNLAHLKSIGYRRLPRPVGKSKRRCAIAFDWSEGQGFRELAGSGRSSGGHAFSVGRALAELHRQSPGVDLQRWDPANEVRRLEALSATLGALVPERARLAREIFERLKSRLDGAARSAVLVHGDFHSKQVLVADSGIRFLDPDELSVGPAGLDIGTFLAHLQRDALRGYLFPGTAESLSAAFLDGYAATTAPTDCIDTFVACALFRFSHHPFRACEPDWPNGIARILGLIDAILRQSTSGRSQALRA